MALTVALLTVGLRRAQSVPPSAREPSAAGEVVTLLANNHLVLVPPGGRAPRWETTLAPAPDTSHGYGFLSTGHRLAWSTDRTTIYALPAADWLGAERLMAVDHIGGRVLQTIHLPEGTRYGGLAVGPVTGQVYLVGQQDKAISIAVVDPGRRQITAVWNGRDMHHWQPQGPVGGDFSVYQAEISPDESRLFYTYHGGLLPKAGLDFVDLTGAGPRTCTPPSPDKACLTGLAGFAPYKGGVLLTSGIDAGDGLVYDYRLDGLLMRTFHLDLGAGFLNDFALDLAGNRLYAVGSCGYVGGLSVLDLTSGKPRLLASTQAGQTKTVPCGQRLALTWSGELVVGRVARLNASPYFGGTLLYIDVATGAVLRTVTLSAEPVDVSAP